MINITDEKYKEALLDIAATDNGKVVLACLMDALKWKTQTLTEKDVILRNFYLESIRSHLGDDVLKSIEFNYHRKGAEHGTEHRYNSVFNAKRGPSRSDR